MRTLTADASRSLRVQLEPPRVLVLSTSTTSIWAAPARRAELTPTDAAAGVRVGDVTYPAYPGTSVDISDPTVRVAMFALLDDLDLTTPIGVFAKDAAGNLATQPLDYTPFVKFFRRSNIEISDAFLQRVVPAILQDRPTSRRR